MIPDWEKKKLKHKHIFTHPLSSFLLYFENPEKKIVAFSKKFLFSQGWV